MKITFIDDEPEIFPLPYGGKARTITNLAGGFTNKGHEVSILTRNINYHKKEFRIKNIRYVGLDYYSLISTIIHEVDNADVVSSHTCSFTLPYLSGFNARVTNHLHDVIVATVDTGSHLDKALSNRWSAIYAPSDFAANTLANTAIKSNVKDKICVIPRGLNENQFFPVEKHEARLQIYEEHGVDLRQVYPLLFFPHRLGASKGEEDLLALQDILRERYPHVSILTVGKPHFHHLLGLPWLTAEQLRNVYAAADVTLILSRLPEAFSQVTIESLACGTQVIAYPFGNLAYLANEFSAIRAVRPELHSISNGVKQCLESDNKTLAKDQVIIKQKYNLEKIIELYERSFANLKANKDVDDIKFIRDNEPYFFLSPTVGLYENTIYTSDKSRTFVLSEREGELLTQLRSAQTLLQLSEVVKATTKEIHELLIQLIKRGIVVKV